MSTTTTSLPYKSRRQRPKIEKSNEEFKQHESILMGKRNTEVNNSVTKKCHVLWNQYLYNKSKPDPLRFNFVYHNLDKYLTVCDNYEPSQHKDPKQKWWNNQKASEMSQGFLPSVLNATDQMAEYLGQQMEEALNPEFAYYCQFELLETALTSVFSTMRSGSNEVFLRTSFQYSKANLRKKLVSYFSDQELRIYDLKARKKKDLWCKLIKEKKDRLLIAFQRKKAMVYGHDHKMNMGMNMNSMSMSMNQHSHQNQSRHQQQQNIFIKQQPDDQYYNPSQSQHHGHNQHQSQNLPPMINFASGNTSNSDTLSCTTNSSNHGNNGNNHIQSQPRLQLMNNDSGNTANTSSTMSSNGNQNPPQIPPINWNELSQQQPSYQPYQTLKLTPYSQPQTIQLIPQQTRTMQTMGYGSHRECQDCLSYMSKMQQLLQVNQKLHDENMELKQRRHQYIAERQELSSKYNNLLLQMNNLQRDNMSNMQVVGHQMPQNNVSNPMNDDTWMTMPSAHDNNQQSSPHSHNSHQSHPSQHGDNNGNNINTNNNGSTQGITAYAQTNHAQNDHF